MDSSTQFTEIYHNNLYFDLTQFKTEYADVNIIHAGIVFTPDYSINNGYLTLISESELDKSRWFIALKDSSCFILKITLSDQFDFFAIDDEIASSCAIVDDFSSNPIHELIEMLSKADDCLIPSISDDDRSVGDSIEKYLGIAANPNKAPDYKGIEIKSSKSKGTSNSLFTKSPLWNKTDYKSNREVLESHGYDKEDRIGLHVTVTAGKPNRQGMELVFDNLGYFAVDIGDARLWCWKEEDIVNEFLKKHRNTLWIKTEPVEINNKAYFKLLSAEYTEPLSGSEFINLLREGVIQIESRVRLLKGDKMPKFKDHGMVFRIPKHHMRRLFPVLKAYTFDSVVKSSKSV